MMPTMDEEYDETEREMTAFIRWLRLSIATGLLAAAYKIVPPDAKGVLNEMVKKRGGTP